MTKAVTINLDDAQAADLERLAVESGVTLEELLSDAVRAHFRLLEQGAEEEWEPTEEDLAAIRQGMEEAERGELVPHEEVMKGVRRIINGEGG